MTLAPLHPESYERLQSWLERCGYEEGAARVGEAAVRGGVIPVSVLEEASRSEVAELRQVVASCSHTPPSLLGVLAADPEQWVRCGVGENPQTPVAALEALLEDPDPVVLVWMLTNRALPSALVAAAAVRLRAADERRFGEDTSYLLAQHPATPTELLEPLPVRHTPPAQLRRCAEAHGLSAAACEVVVGPAAAYEGSVAELLASASCVVAAPSH